MKLIHFVLIGILLLASFLRFYKIDEIPHGLYIDEVSIGYNAYTILTKGVDEHGVSYPLFFQAFGEYKMPIPIYLTSASIAVFGKNDFAVRFPSALFGTLTVLLLFFFTKELLRFSHSLKIENWKLKIPIVAAALLAVTPWHIQFSRANFEANIALFFYLLGGFLFMVFLQTKKNFLLFGSFLTFLLTVYTYNSYRLIAPMTIIACGIVVFRLFPKLRKLLMTTSVVILFLFLPMLVFSLTPEGAERFSSQSAFAKMSHLSPVEKVITYPVVYLSNYFSYFSLSFLFVTGDGNGRHTVTTMGNLFRFELVFFLAGCFFLFQKRKEFFAKVLLFVLLLAPATAAFASPNPHTLRSFLLVIPLTVIVAYGLVTLWNKKFFLKKIVFAGVFLFAIYEGLFYLHSYTVHYPIRTAPDWGAEYKSVILDATKEQQNYSRIIINDNLGMVAPYIYFYNDVLTYELVNDSWIKTFKKTDEKVLYITSSSEKRNIYLEPVPRKLIKTIYLPSVHKGIFAQYWEL